MRPSTHLAAIVCGLALTACGGGPGSAPVPVGPPAGSLYVKATGGSDANPGTAALPLETLTKACTLALPGQWIVLEPGLYDAANGEVFPIEVPDGVTIEGDVPNRGQGPLVTLVRGKGLAIPGVNGTIVLHEGSVVRGLTVDVNFLVPLAFGLVVANATAEVRDCTFPLGSYGGVYLDGSGATDVHHCAFGGTYYGVWLAGPTGAVQVRDNTFSSSSIGVRADFGPNASIHDNLFATNTDIGVQLVGYDGLVQGNTFAFSGYAVAALEVAAGLPILRDNMFTCNKGILVQGGVPDLGTVLDAGGNDFAGVSGFAVRHEGVSGLEAQGNAWQHVPPTKGTDIVVTSLVGTVRYGPNLIDIVP